jgi:hypothetical protein
VAGHIFQARPVWIYTQSNITSIKKYNMKYTPSFCFGTFLKTKYFKRTFFAAPICKSSIPDVNKKSISVTLI